MAGGERYRTITDVRDPIVIAERMEKAVLGELVHLEDGRNGEVLALEKGVAVIQVFEGTDGLGRDSTVELTGRPYETRVSEDVLGRVYDGFGKPLDGGPPIVSGERRQIGGSPINPSHRDHPEQFIETGITSIDLLNSLVAGQKLPIFSMAGLPHNELAAQIITQADIQNLVVIFCGLGLTYDDYEYFRLNAITEETRERTVMFMNLASDPAVERLITPKLALTHAEHLAFEQGYNVLVVMSDMRNYCDALREVSGAKREMPGRGGYPTYMYTSLASIYERAGIIKGKKGTITQIGILTMPNDDIGHPIPDLTGFITEGQIVMDRDLFLKGIFPPINILPSLSRMMGSATGAGKTTPDHREVSDQLYAFYSEGIGVRRLASVIGEEALTDEERKLLAFAGEFEGKVLNQQLFERRSLERSLDLAWEALSRFDSSDLIHISDENVKKGYKGEKKP
jgi:V/A-type H+-transporting ATPase subunit B